MRLALLVASLALTACKAQVKDVTLGDYRYTLSPGWGASESDGTGFHHVAFDAFGYDGSCLVEVFSVPVAPQAYLAQMEKTFSAREPKPATFTMRFGALEGATFDGELPANVPLGSLARLAGTPSFEVYAGKDGETAVGLMIMTLGNAEDRAAARAQCASILSSMRRAEAKPAAPAR